MTTRTTLLLTAFLIAGRAPAAVGAPPPDRVVVDVGPGAIAFVVRNTEIAFLRVEVFDPGHERVFDSGLVDATEFRWDLRREDGNFAAPGIYFYLVQAWNDAGAVAVSRVGKAAVSPADLDRRTIDPLGEKLSVPLAFDVNGDFAVFGNLGVGTDQPERSVHLQGRNAVFRMDRDVNSAAFLLTRTAQNDFSTIWKTFSIGVNASGPGDGSFIVNDLGANVGGGGTRRLTIDNDGRVGLNTSAPAAALEVVGTGEDDLFVLRDGGDAAFRVENDGDVFADGAYYCGLPDGCFNAGQGADVAERIDTDGDLAPGEVVEIDPDRPRRFRRTTSALSRRVAGIVSTAPAITLGNAFDPEADRWTDGRPLLALAGRVPVKVTAESRAIAIGDLLVSSPVPGHAMSCPALADCLGAVVGKALEALADGRGTVLAQVSLR